MKSWQNKDTEVKRRCTADTAEAQGDLLRLSFRVSLTVCSDFPSLSSHMPGVYDQTGCATVSVFQHRLFCHMRCRDAAPDRPLALRSLPALLSLTLTRNDWVGTDTQEENPQLQQIFDDGIFVGLEMEADVDICVTSAQSGRRSLSLSLAVFISSCTLSLIINPPS